MLNIQVNQKKGEAVIEASGSSIDMAAELLYVVAHIYKTLERRAAIPEEGFKMLIQAAVEDEKGPCWNGKVSGERHRDLRADPQKGGVLMEERTRQKREEFGEMLAKIRKEAGMKQTELAEKAGLSLGAVAVWEAGYNFPRMDSLLRVADALDKDVEIRLVDKGNQMTQMKE